MRSSRIVVLLCAVALLVAPQSFAFQEVTTPDSVMYTLPTTPSKVCHPKKPVTCSAADLLKAASQAPATSQPATGVTNSSTKSVSPESKQSMACGPWVRWMCYNTVLG